MSDDKEMDGLLEILSAEITARSAVVAERIMTLRRTQKELIEDKAKLRAACIAAKMSDSFVRLNSAAQRMIIEALNETER